MPESTFVEDGSDYCKTHKQMDDLMERADELFEHGYFATNFINFAKHLSPEKFLFAVEMFDGLTELSQFDLEVERVERNLDTSGSDLIQENSVNVELPMPQSALYKFQATELWYAALTEVMQQNMKEVVFKDGVAVDTISQSADMEGKITDTKTEKTEHHLHLPISRVTKDIKEHLKNGGVEIDSDDGGGVLTFQKNDYTLSVKPGEESTDDESETPEPISAEQFTQEMEDDGEAAEIELE